MNDDIDWMRSDVGIRHVTTLNMLNNFRMFIYVMDVWTSLIQSRELLAVT